MHPSLIPTPFPIILYILHFIFHTRRDNISMKEINKITDNVARMKFTAPTFEIIFTPEEVNERTVHDGNPPRLSLLKKRTKIEGKKPYSDLLCQKVEAVLPMHSKCRVGESFKNWPTNKTRAYMFCEHNNKLPISYRTSDLQENSALKMTLVAKCYDCCGPQAPAPPFRDFDVSSCFYRASHEVCRYLQAAMNECNAADNPEQELARRKVQIGQGMVDIWYNCANTSASLRAARDPFEELQHMWSN
jgi:hypothetical protein